MRSNFKILSTFCLIAVMVLGFAISASAQGRGAPQTPAEQKAAFDTNFSTLVTSLVLAEEQSPKMKEILWTAQEKRNEMMASLRGGRSGGGGGGGGQRGAIREKIDEMNKETLALLADVLTADQLKKYEEIQATQQQGRGQRQGRPQGQNRP